MHFSKAPGVPYALFFALSALSCRGCSGGGSGAPALRFVGKDAQAVLEIRDLGALAEKKAALASAIADVVPPEQIAALERELELALGFSPTTEKGLEAAGLPKHGSIAVELADGGQTAMWIVPVTDASKFEAIVQKLVRSRASVDAVEKQKIGDREVTAYLASFGPDKALVAMFAEKDGVALIGAGAKSRVLIERALGASAGSIADNPEYTALTKSLPQGWELRLVSPSAGTSIASALRTLGSLTSGRAGELLKNMPEIRGIKSTGWSLSFADRGASIDGRVRLDESGLADNRAVFAARTPSPAGVNAIAFEDAVIFAHFAGDASAFFAKVAPPGTPMHTRLQALFARIKTDIGADLEKDLLPQLSGHGALAMGVGNLAGKDLRMILENPAAVIWTVIALGAASPDKIAELEQKMDAGLAARGLGVSSRKIGEADARVVSTSAPEQPPAMVVESVSAGGARILSNDAARTEAAVAEIKSNPKDPHSGKTGGVLEVRLGELAKALRSLDFAKLDVLQRALLSKGLQVVGAFDRVTVHFTPVEDGLSFTARVQLQPAGTGPAGK